MSIEIKYFVHGTTLDNENNIATGWLPGELSEKGIAETKELAKIIKNDEYDAVFCSDLKRAKDSASILFGERYKVIPDSRLRECNYGEKNGSSKKFQDKDSFYYINQKFPNGESFRDVEKRINDFILHIKEQYNNKKIAIVSHCYPQLALDVILKNKTWEQALKEDWRKTHTWQPGWEYQIN